MCKNWLTLNICDRRHVIVAKNTANMKLGVASYFFNKVVRLNDTFARAGGQLNAKIQFGLVLKNDICGPILQLYQKQVIIK